MMVLPIIYIFLCSVSLMPSNLHEYEMSLFVVSFVLIAEQTAVGVQPRRTLDLLDLCLCPCIMFTSESWIQNVPTKLWKLHSCSAGSH